MRKGIICFISLFLLLAFCRLSDARYDFFGGFIPEGTPTIDGVISSGEWKESGKTTLYKFFGEDSKIEIYMMWDSTYLYLNAKIEDFELWVDSYDPVKPWESTWDDDAFKWEIDPDFSRDEYMQSNDRVFAINANGSATRFDKGDGAGGTLGVSPVYSIVSAAIADGILNDYTFKTLVSESQKDKGFVVEIAISWKDIFGSSASVAPGDGYSLGMNFTNIEDDTGGPLDAGYYNEWKRVYDEITRFMGEEGHPENWAEFVLSSKNDRTPPAAVSSLTISNTNAFSTGISFTATGDNGSSGYAKAYDIRYSQSAITSASWSSTTEYRNNFRPQKAGKKESFKIIGLSPNTKYYIGVRAVDEQGNASEIATASFTTTAAGGPDDKGFLAVDPGQRYFAWEKGDPMVVIGDNQGIGWPGIRCFYNGPMWSDSLWQNINWYDQEGMQDGRDYLKYLSDHGVNTIRIFAEDMQPYNPVYLFTDVSAGPSNIVFNQNTLDFLETLLDECAKV
ncbi:MAG: hypothetical protein JXA35_03665, partial [Deltaproteobacteria bacterium]|nr:hypothetical protein [Deltaproteobacteria bacterium]